MRKILIILLLTFIASFMQAQRAITIGGNVYGGGNAGNLGGSTSVTIRGGNIQGKVFGGARQANVEGSAFVHIDGENMSDDILINAVYGGNDIAGTIGTSTAMPTGLTEAAANNIDNSYSAFVLVSPEKTETKTEEGETTTSQPHHIFIGNLFGGGNGDYTYVEKENGKYTATIPDSVWDEDEEAFVHTTTTLDDVEKPELGKAYLEIKGGTIAYLYGGGNNATVTTATDICINNNSEVTTAIPTGATSDNNLLIKNNGERLKDMGIAVLEDVILRDTYHFSRVFGGNNKAEMHIRPTWHLEKGNIENLYSGGNEGPMTSPEGLLLEILENSQIMVDNVYGGCRKADVHPKTANGDDVAESSIQLSDTNEDGSAKYRFPAGLSARVLVRGGHINNVYGGNDITGSVKGGNAVGVYTSIQGDIYGGGNGSYPYTDNEDLKETLEYGDYYYDPSTGTSSADALNAFRPNAEQVSIRVAGKKVPKEANSTDSVVVNTIIHGSIFLGGNSATLKRKAGMSHPTVELKVGSYVIADNVFLGNNGANMVTEDLLAKYREEENFSTLNLTNPATFAEYMKGAAMDLIPSVTFDNQIKGDPATYIPYTTSIGSFYCGGNVGSMTYEGTDTMNFNVPVYIYDKIVGGCNNAIVPIKKDANGNALNARYEGGILGTAAEQITNDDGYSYTDEDGNIRNRLVLNVGDSINGGLGVQFLPKRWNADRTDLEWNIIKSSTGEPYTPTAEELALAADGKSTEADLDRRLDGGHIYGGCYTSGIVNGNVVINLNATTVNRNLLFDKVKEDSEGEASNYGDNILNQGHYTILERRTGVILGQQGMDVLGTALNVYGGGKGKDTEIWGSTTINLNRGYTFQVFGGSEEGVIGRPKTEGNYSFNDKIYSYDPRYSCYVNLRGKNAGVSKQKDQSESMAECEFMYGGGFLGPIIGNTIINLGQGRIFNSFAGACNADILGHSETYIGRQVNDDGSFSEGFPYIRDYVYGGNDLGGRILNEKSFKDQVRDEETLGMVYGYQASTETDPGNTAPDVLTASAYIEYRQGRALGIFGGCFGTYNYKDEKFRQYTDENGNAKEGFTKPRMGNAFINFRPTSTSELKTNEYNYVEKVYGAGQGYPGDGDRDVMQERSYVLIDIPQDMTNNYQNMEVFGAGAWSGLGMGVKKDKDDENPDGLSVEENPDRASAIIDLVHGRINAAYGASYEEGITRRTVVNVPSGSTIQMNRIFGGAYGIKNSVPCDVIEAHVNFSSNQALVGNYRDGIYGGNNNYRRTLYSFVNINAPVFYDKEQEYYGTVFGAGYGQDTWSEYTVVNLNDGAKVYEAYGGGNAGMVLNKASVAKWKAQEQEQEKTLYTAIDNYTEADLQKIESKLVKPNRLGSITNTNVNINQGGSVSGYYYKGDLSGGYCYGGGFGSTANVSGTTYIGLHGGTVAKDLYGSGYGGSVLNKYESKTDSTFTASTNVYIEGGTVRNVYGGGYQGHVGKHEGALSAAWDNDVLAVTNVIIGIRGDLDETGLTYYRGVPAIQRNAFSGGEGGSIYGTANLTINNGYIGYYYDPQDTQKPYKEKIYDETWHDQTHPLGTPNTRLEDCGNAFGGGYDDLSTCDYTNVKVYGGVIRNGLFGGGEIATVGRGATKQKTGVIRELDQIYRHGGTHIEMYNGHVLRNVFGGGKGYNKLRYGVGHELYTDGYVFGQTEVYIHGGEIGTIDGIDEGYGNVFGGGDIGYVYGNGEADYTETTGSPGHYYYKKDGHLTEDCKVVIEPYAQVKKTWKDITNPRNNDDDKTNDEETAVTGVVTIGGHDYLPGQYVPTDTLNTLKGKNDISNIGSGVTENTNAYNHLLLESDRAKWAKLDDTGIIIHNAVFGGGNVSSGSDQIYANATTVFGNVTATLRDVYHRDLITVGYERVGGLYGGGNLSLVDGYRELHIANYGTDYYGLTQTIPLEQYYRLTDREKAYFRLRYTCKKYIASYTDNYGIFHKAYNVGDPIYQEEYEDLEDEYQSDEYWTTDGVCSIYAGRLLNTIQRADLCGVYGSRIVLMGARDRVVDVADYTRYTLNRVGELSLHSQATTANDTDDASKSHGNYFGIYSLVNYLGNLSSDVKMEHVRTSDTNDTDGTTTYYQWKQTNHNNRKRNVGTCHNEVALASGVFLELTTENSTKDEKDYGYITGVVELDLINAKTDEVGGGYIYAKNEHGTPTFHEDAENVTLSPYNQNVVTYKRYTYDEQNLEIIQTSGNFIHDSHKRIIDDCYPNNAEYDPTKENYSKAHYWFVKGNIYIYDQIISAYTGSANAYPKQEKIPLTITPGSHGRLTLLNVQPNLYAYWKNGQQTEAIVDSTKIENNTRTVLLNDVISYWDYSQLNENDQKVFVPETKVSVTDYTLSETSTDTIKAGKVMTPSAYNNFVNGLSAKIVTIDDQSVTIQHPLYDVTKQQWVEADEVYHSSNNMSSSNGYVLTFEMDSPQDWNKWYSLIEGAPSSINTPDYAALTTHADSIKYIQGPTFRTTATESTPYGQRYYEQGEVIPEVVVENYPESLENQEGQAKVVKAYAAKTDEVEYSYTDEHGETHEGTFPSGTAISETIYNRLDESTKNKLEQAQVCTNTVQLAENAYLFVGDVVTSPDIENLALTYVDGHFDEKKFETATEEERNAEKARLKAEGEELIQGYLTPAYYCDAAGLYGGKIFSSNTNYSPIDSWCSLSSEDRKHFLFNGDAFDLLIDPDFRGRTTGENGGLNDNGELYRYGEPYCKTYPVEYTAMFQASDDLTSISFTKEGETTPTVVNETNPELTNVDYEKYIANEQYHFTPIKVTKTPAELINDEGEDYYIVKKRFVRADIPYEVGQLVSASVYRALTGTEREEYIEVQKFLNTTQNDDEYVYYFYCREDFVVGEKGGYTDEQKRNGTNEVVYTDVFDGSKKYYVGNTIPKGTFITKEEYKNLPNLQKNFLIKGMEPTETTTLYVARESDINDLSKERIYSVIYQYTYNEGDDSGENVELVNELHVINIHVQFESGVPSVGTLTPPSTVLPGNTVGTKEPRPIIPGAFEIIGGGWEIYDNKTDAENHRNGKPFTPNQTQVYWYQNQRSYVAYYAKTYLGKTYSNSVPLSVANYHDMANVMADTEHHMYVDYDPAKLTRHCKIYINDYSDDDKNGLDILKNFFDLSCQTSVANSGATEGHALLNENVKGGENLDFFLRTDIDHPGSWTSIGNDSQCFAGTFHGDGYTISGLDHSLFGSLCSDVYNLGVTGTFTGAGIAEKGSGYVENCWISTTSTEPKTTKPVFGEPTNLNDTRPYRIVNCYYAEEKDAANKYTNHSSNYGIPIPKTPQAFYNGEVAYNLNGFYLKRRYYDGIQQTGDTEYNYLTTNADGTLSEEMSPIYYPVLTSDNAQYGDLGYVERRYANVDFIYANGKLPESSDIRMRTQTEGAAVTPVYAPIWPDDYLFFGQRLTYGYYSTPSQDSTKPDDESSSHDELPTHITSNNRVYRAPAYFQSKQMGAVHFNPDVLLAAQSKDKAHTAYPNMTAIDFTGYGDATYRQGFNGQLFYQPLLDDNGICSIKNIDLTKNLLVYTKADTQTDNVVGTYLYDEAYVETRRATYRTVAPWDTYKDNIHGHRVQLADDGYVAPNDHMLVDKEDFNAPIEYRMGDYRMWYQRTPDNFVDLTKGWEAISIPFTAELVTTQNKGELTHFYDGSLKGHEYWLREYKGKKISDNNVFTALFDYPAQQTTPKTVTNTFLWDYYYSKNAQKDLNGDTYQTYYQQPSRQYDGYPLLAADTPYLIGFPGQTYYEFDLSGNFRALTTAESNPEKLDKQTITFVSAEGETIHVSDDEMKKAAKDGYTFVPNYLSKEVEGYLLDTEGSSFDKTETAIAAVPFRPYFIAGTASAKPRQMVEHIIFDKSDDTSFDFDDNDPTQGEASGSLTFYTKKHLIGVTSSLRTATNVTIVNTGGLTIASFTIQPGETIETQVPMGGVYIVNKHKLMVK